MIPPLPPCSSILSCALPPQYISLGLDRPGLPALPGRLLIFFVSCFLFLAFVALKKVNK
jgi:hypothetical protein